MASPQNPTFSAQPPQKKGCGIWTILGVGCLVVVLICAGIIGGGTYWVKQNVTITEAPAEVTARVQAIRAICERHGVPIAGAALQFPLAHPIVASVIPGPRNVDEFETNMKLLRHPIPAALWADLRDAGLLHPEAPTPPDLATPIPQEAP